MKPQTNNRQIAHIPQLPVILAGLAVWAGSSCKACAGFVTSHRAHAFAYAPSVGEMYVSGAEQADATMVWSQPPNYGAGAVAVAEIDKGTAGVSVYAYNYGTGVGGSGGIGAGSRAVWLRDLISAGGYTGDLWLDYTLHATFDTRPLGGVTDYTYGVTWAGISYSTAYNNHNLQDAPPTRLGAALGNHASIDVGQYGAGATGAITTYANFLGMWDEASLLPGDTVDYEFFGKGHFVLKYDPDVGAYPLSYALSAFSEVSLFELSADLGQTLKLTGARLPNGAAIDVAFASGITFDPPTAGVPEPSTLFLALSAGCGTVVGFGVAGRAGRKARGREPDTSKLAARRAS